MKKYIVGDGDTLESISEATGIRLSLLQSANPQLQSPFVLQPGQVMSLPELNKLPETQPKQDNSGSVPPVAKGEHSNARHASSTQTPPASQSTVPGYLGIVWPHVVRTGESWSSIASAYQINQSALEQMNIGKDGVGLQPGDVLYVPNVLTQALGYPATATVTVNPSAPLHLHYWSYPSYRSYPGYPVGSVGSVPPMMPGAIPFYGPFVRFPAGAQTLGPRALDALWRKSDSSLSAWRDVDDSSLYESSWSATDNWGGSDPHDQ